jgi:prephenate dehydrogenase
MNKKSELGIVGLGRMGANIARRLMRDGHRCVVYDVNADVVNQLSSEGADGASSLAELAGRRGRSPKSDLRDAGAGCRLCPANTGMRRATVAR